MDRRKEIVAHEHVAASGFPGDTISTLLYVLSQGLATQNPSPRGQNMYTQQEWQKANF